MLKLKPYSATILAFGGFLLVAMGVYFVFLRPPLLREDFKYIGTNSSFIKENIPQVDGWLRKVFWVMGSYIFTSGLLIIFVALTSFRSRMNGAFIIITIVGLSSIGSMTIINFIINSDFKWVLLAFTFPWLIALILYRLQK